MASPFGKGWSITAYKGMAGLIFIEKLKRKFNIWGYGLHKFMNLSTTNEFYSFRDIMSLEVEK